MWKKIAFWSTNILKRGIPYATRKFHFIFHHSKQIFLTTSIKLFCKFEDFLTLHLVKFRGDWPSSSEKLHAVTHKEVENMDMCFYNCQRCNFLRNLTRMIKIIFDSYIGFSLSPIKFGTTHDNHLNRINWKQYRWYK